MVLLEQICLQANCLRVWIIWHFQVLIIWWFWKRLFLSTNIRSCPLHAIAWCVIVLVSRRHPLFYTWTIPSMTKDIPFSKMNKICVLYLRTDMCLAILSVICIWILYCFVDCKLLRVLVRGKEKINFCCLCFAGELLLCQTCACCQGWWSFAWTNSFTRLVIVQGHTQDQDRFLFC